MDTRHTSRRRSISCTAAGDSLASAHAHDVPAEPRGTSEPEQRTRLGLHRFDDVLGRFSDALALVETAYGALARAQEDESPIGAGVLTLHRGLEDMKEAYTDFDLALAHVRADIATTGPDDSCEGGR